jgi:hypothetical protein
MEVTEKMKDTETMNTILEKLREDDGAWICRPAADDDIKRCNRDLDACALNPLPVSSAEGAKRTKVPLPEDYAAFLKICNGFSWNGIQFWGTDMVTEEGNVGLKESAAGFKLMDIASMSDEYDTRYYDNHETEMLYLGRSDDDIYVYNFGEKRYEIRSMEEGCGEANEDFPTFAELFMFTAGGRMGHKRYV